MLHLQLDKTKFSITAVSDDDAESADKAYWRSLTPQERLEALEWLRQSMYGYDPTTIRLQRVFEIAEFPPR